MGPPRLLPRSAAWTLLVVSWCLLGGCVSARKETYEGNTARLSDLLPPQPPPFSRFGRVR